MIVVKMFMAFFLYSVLPLEGMAFLMHVTVISSFECFNVFQAS